MKCVGVIPARYASTRLPGKPLIPIAGVPLLQRVIEGAGKAQHLADLFVATDDERIAALSRQCGVEAIMTSPDLPSGSDRVWAAIQGLDVDVVVNIQGDEPLLTGALLDTLVKPFYEDNSIQMTTLGREITLEDLESATTAKIIVDCNMNALYFSRLPIPYSRKKWAELKGGCLKHIGLYAYRKSFLAEFCRQKPVAIEEAESLEQLRALYLGAKIRVVQVEHESWGVDTPEDVKKIERMIREEWHG